MPILEFQCSCGNREDHVTWSYETNPERTCSVCGEQMQRAPSYGTAFVLKGGGWSKDLYQKKSGGTDEV